MNKVVSIEEIKKISQKAKREKKIIVFTNGCFDLIHPGHIECLYRAKKLGSLLIVGLNTDSSIRNFKGASRPIFNEIDRANVLSAIRYVDYIVFFDDPTPQRLISAIIPHILVKGGDYKTEKVVGREVVEKNGGKVVIIPLLKGYSTTEIIKRCVMCDVECGMLQHTTQNIKH